MSSTREASDKSMWSFNTAAAAHGNVSVMATKRTDLDFQGFNAQGHDREIDNWF